jgi:putative PIN family toxin of toxin-antitoxin system
MALAPDNPRVFLDTNVIFSALYSAKGAPNEILSAFIRGEITVIISRQVLEELVRNISEKLPAVLPVLKAMLVNAPPEITPDPSLEEIKQWEEKLALGDAMVLAAAVSAKVDYFITGDNHFLASNDLKEKAGIDIITPAQFLRLMKEAE